MRRDSTQKTVRRYFSGKSKSAAYTKHVHSHGIIASPLKPSLLDKCYLYVSYWGVVPMHKSAYFNQKVPKELCSCFGGFSLSLHCLQWRQRTRIAGTHPHPKNTKHCASSYTCSLSDLYWSTKSITESFPVFHPRVSKSGSQSILAADSTWRSISLIHFHHSHIWAFASIALISHMWDKPETHRLPWLNQARSSGQIWNLVRVPILACHQTTKPLFHPGDASREL